MKAKARQQAAAELIAFLHSDKINFNGAQLGMVTRWVEWAQFTAKEAEKELQAEGDKK